MQVKVVRLKIREAAAELNVCCKTIHNFIKKYASTVDRTNNDFLPSTPTNGLRGIAISRSNSGRITWRIDSRDLEEYIENAGREIQNLTPRNWRDNR